MKVQHENNKKEHMKNTSEAQTPSSFKCASLKIDDKPKI